MAQLIGKWAEIFKQEYDKPYMQTLKQFIRTERETNRKTIYPPSEHVFAAYELTPFERTRIVILGQDPYHNGHAHGLAFSSCQLTIPPSLQIMFNEIQRSMPEDYSGKNFRNGNLINWANQGVLLINPVLTVERGKPSSHEGKGWEYFTNAILQALSSHPRRLIFMFWGKKAQMFAKVANLNKHLLLMAPHPAAEAYKPGVGFIGCGHFKSANLELIKQEDTPINWSVI